MTFVYTPFVLNLIPAPIMQPVSKHRRIDIESEPRLLTRAESIRRWQANAIDDTSNYGPNPFRSGDEVEVENEGDWMRARVVIARGRFEHYRVLIEIRPPERPGAWSRRWVKAFDRIRIYESRRVRALKID